MLLVKALNLFQVLQKKSDQPTNQPETTSYIKSTLDTVSAVNLLTDTIKLMTDYLRR